MYLHLPHNARNNKETVSFKRRSKIGFILKLKKIDPRFPLQRHLPHFSFFFNENATKENEKNENPFKKALTIIYYSVKDNYYTA